MHINLHPTCHGDAYLRRPWPDLETYQPADPISLTNQRLQYIYQDIFEAHVCSSLIRMSSLCKQQLYRCACAFLASPGPFVTTHKLYIC